MSSVWLNGEFLNDEKILLSAFDHPFLRGDGIFESTRTEDDQIYFLDRHIDRLLRSATIMEIPAPDPAQILTVAQAVVSRSQLSGQGTLRITVFSNGDLLVTHRASISNSELPKLVTYSEPQFSQSQIAVAKSLSYGRSAAALRWADKQGANEVVFIDENGMVLETAVANIVVEVTGQLITPSLARGGLVGITRSLVLDWFPEVSERPLHSSELKSATGILLMSGIRFIRPALSLDGRALQITPKMQSLASEFEIRARANPNS